MKTAPGTATLVSFLVLANGVGIAFAQNGVGDTGSRRSDQGTSSGFRVVAEGDVRGVGRPRVEGRARVDRSTTKGFQYVVKTLCDGPEDSPLAQATYQTVTSIVNPNDATTQVYFESQTPGEARRFGDFEIEAYGVEPLDVEGQACAGGDDPLPFSQTTTVITSCRRPLAITVVYTSEKDDETVSIDVEQIAAREVRLDRLDCIDTP